MEKKQDQAPEKKVSRKQPAPWILFTYTFVFSFWGWQSAKKLAWFEPWLLAWIVEGICVGVAMALTFQPLMWILGYRNFEESDEEEAKPEADFEAQDE